MQAFRKLWLVFLAGALMAACAPAQPGRRDVLRAHPVNQVVGLLREEHVLIIG